MNSMPRDQEPVTVERLHLAHDARRAEIRKRLREFREVWRAGSDARLWEELVYCIFTAGASAKMGLRSVEAVRPLLKSGKPGAMTRALVAAGAHRFPNARPHYVAATRAYLKASCAMRLRDQLESFRDPVERRAWLAGERRVERPGYQKTSGLLIHTSFRGQDILD